MKLERRERSLAMNLSKLSFNLTLVLWGALAACADDADIADEAVLSTLSSSELGDLCDELQDTWSEADSSVECSDGSTVTFEPPMRGSCGSVDLQGCPVTVGELRECTQALVADPCAAATTLPTACAELDRAGCGEATSPQTAATCAPPTAAALAPLDGVYELVAHTENTSDCDTEGGSVIANDDERLFVVVSAEVFGSPLSTLESCRDLADCRQRATRIRSANEDPVGVTLEASLAPELRENIRCTDAEGTLFAESLSFGRSIEGDCSLAITETSVVQSSSGALRLEGKTLSWRKPLEDDSCTFSAGETPTDASCSLLEVYEARFLSAL